MEEKCWDKDYIDKIEIKTDWPVIGRLHDELYPFEGYDHIRYTARALAVNEEGKFVFLHIKGEDYFGERDHLESCGGGVEEGEFLDDALKREVAEELGYGIRSMALLGSIYDAYNLIGRITFSTFFFVELDTSQKKETHRTEEEKILISEVVFLEADEAIRWLESGKNRIDKLIQQRDLLAMRYLLEQMKAE